MRSILDYLDQAQAIVERIRTTELTSIEEASELCAQTIAGEGLVHLFGTGH